MNRDCSAADLDDSRELAQVIHGRFAVETREQLGAYAAHRYPAGIGANAESRGDRVVVRAVVPGRAVESCTHVGDVGIVANDDDDNLRDDRNDAPPRERSQTWS